MSDLITFFDLETPNKRNDKVCSIALVQTTTEGDIVERRSYLIDPETNFDDINIHIHRIAPIDVKGMKTLPELWDDELSSIISGTRLVAHNAQFDLCVLAKAFEGYGIPVRDPLYADTMRMAQKAIDGISDLKLPTICHRLGIEMGPHHVASSDADACREIFWSLVNPDDDVNRYFSTYIFHKSERKASRHHERKLIDETRDMATLVKLLSGVISDGSVSLDEALDVLVYVTTHKSLINDPAVSEVTDAIQLALMDGDLSTQEANRLEAFFERLVDPVSAGADSHDQIEFNGRKFVLTGNFEHGSKGDIGKFIEDRGGTVVGGTSKKVAYVVVGGCGSDDYAMGSYGTKVKKALDLQAQGVPIRIVRECELFGD